MIWKVSKKSFRVQFIWLVPLILFAGTTFSNQREPNPPHLIEVFTSAQYPIVEPDAKRGGTHLRRVEITLYEIDGIQSVERDLSLNLPVEPQQSKQVALQRIQNLDAQTRLRMQSAATALEKVIQYGVDRYPAVVFDGEAVVYGVTDLTLAFEQYRAWRTVRRP